MNEGYDDFETMLEFDESILIDEIGMNKLHFKKFQRRIKRFKENHDIFTKWLVNELNMKDYESKLTNDGIMTFELFYNTFQNINELIKYLDNHKNDANILWNSLPKNKRNKNN